MPEPAALRRTEVDGQTVITVGARVIACFDTTDVGMRNITVQTLTQTLRFTGRRVGQVMGLTPEYVSELRGTTVARTLASRGTPSASAPTRCSMWCAATSSPSFSTGWTTWWCSTRCPPRS